ncbi:MAG: hypothetical protein JRI57_00990 [Deltaproteobacteria bacterium]|nr:hypothetical protein [Deltaproteobacteria bacterium]MBW1952394.1 hypothetical protein [Deltaproteobacteria bacterium]MBW1985905.1 hypothetical protein [Deltaproteobacteria bacterium]MBW2133665.1 hypothetical protein [Deltaproteobacteria bacterium]
MEIPEYVTIEEVKKVCRELKISDWTALTEPKVRLEEARKIMGQMDLGGMDIPVEDFCRGLEVELEHGLRFKEANVTNNHPILTGKIVLAHFKESLDYYQRLEVAELEGDLLKAVKAQNWPKVERLYKELAAARLELSQVETRLLG